MEPTWGPDYWPWWLICVSVTFLVPEFWALATNALNTLSWYSWIELHVRPAVPFDQNSAAWYLSQGAFLVMTTWLYWHIWYARFT